MYNKMIARLGEGTAVGVPDTNALGKLIGTVMQFAATLGALFLLFNLLMGSLNWINSQGDKEKVDKARKQITNAFIGLTLLIIIMALYFTITIDIFGIFERDPVTNDIKFVLPSLFGP